MNSKRSLNSKNLNILKVIRLPAWMAILNLIQNGFGGMKWHMKLTPKIKGWPGPIFFLFQALFQKTQSWMLDASGSDVFSQERVR